MHHRLTHKVRTDCSDWTAREVTLNCLRTFSMTSDEATVEGWVKWDRFQGLSRFFNYGDAFKDMSIAAWSNGDLWFVIAKPTETVSSQRLEAMRIPGLLRAGQWCHVAGVSRPAGHEALFQRHTGGFS